MRRIFSLFIVLVLIFGFTVSTHATLVPNGGGLIYDTDLNITWLQDANYAVTSGYDADGRMTWSNAVAWADQLSYGGFDDWRLPTTVDGWYTFSYDGTTTAGYNITTSEMGHLYYESLMNKGYYATDGTNPQPGWGLNNTGPFSNLQADHYWSGTEDSLYPYLAWEFIFDNGFQSYYVKDNYEGVGFAWAVRDGDSTPVPEPSTMLLLGSGLIGLLGFRRKFRK